MRRNLILISLIMSGTLALATTLEDLQSGIKDVWKKPALTKAEMARSKKWTRLNADRRMNCFRDQMQIYELETTLFPDWKEAWMKRSSKKFNDLWVKTASSKKFFPSATHKSQQFDGIQRAAWATTLKSSAEQFFKQYKKIESVDLNMTDFTVDYKKRKDDLKFNHFEGVMEAVINGVGDDNHRRSDRGTWKVQFEKDAKGKWKIAAVKVVSGETLTAMRAPAFVNASKDHGLSDLPIYLRTEAIRRGGYALSVADVNKDGIDDLLVGYRDGLGLYLGTKKGTYREALKGSGLEKLKYVKTAVFADFRNAGIQDLVVTTLRPEKGQNKQGASAVYYFHGDGKGHFKNQHVDFGKKRAFLQPMPAAAGDFNNDGYLDLYVGYPGIQDFTILKKGAGIKDVQGLYLNDKKGSFIDFTDHFRVGDYKNDTHLYPHSSLAANFDQNKGIDILVADDRNDLSPVYVNTGNVRFDERAEKIGIGNRGLGMSIAIGDYNNDGISDLAWTNVNFTPIQRASRSCYRHWDVTLEDTEEGLRLFQGLGHGKFKETTESAGITSYMGQGDAGLTFLDYNHDGLMDIYLVNGLWSGASQADEISTLFGIYMNSDLAHTSMVHALAAEDTAGFKKILRESSGHLNYQGDFAPAKKMHPSLAGFQRNQLLRNNGDGTFTDVAYLEGVDSVADGYIVGTIINKEGLPDLILRNGDPGTTDHQYPVVQYFKNQMPGKTRAVLMTLEGTRSNKDAIGSYVVAKYKSHQQVQHLVSNSGSLQNQKLLAFYLGEEKAIPSMEIHWPSGTVQVLKDVKPGFLHVKESQQIRETRL